MAAVLWGGKGTTIARTSAAVLWKLPGFAPGRVEIYHPRSKKTRSEVVVHRVRLDPRDVTRIRAFPVTTPGRTLVDVAPKLSAESFDAIFHHCLHSRLTTWNALQDLAERHGGPGCRGAGRLREALLSYAGGGRAAASPLEGEARPAPRQIQPPEAPPPIRGARRREKSVSRLRMARGAGRRRGRRLPVALEPRSVGAGSGEAPGVAAGGVDGPPCDQGRRGRELRPPAGGASPLHWAVSRASRNFFAWRPAPSCTNRPPWLSLALRGLEC